MNNGTIVTICDHRVALDGPGLHLEHAVDVEYCDGHLRLNNGMSLADKITGRENTGYKNFNPFDLRSCNLTHSQDTMLRDCIRIARQSDGSSLLSVGMNVQQDHFPAADVMLLSLLERIIARAIATFDRCPPQSLRSSHGPR